jgi:hypothetical protein
MSAPYTIIDDYLCNEELYKVVQGFEISTAQRWSNKDAEFDRYTRFERGIRLRNIEEVSLFKRILNI